MHRLSCALWGVRPIAASHVHRETQKVKVFVKHSDVLLSPFHFSGCLPFLGHSPTSYFSVTEPLCAEVLH